MKSLVTVTKEEDELADKIFDRRLEEEDTTDLKAEFEKLKMSK
jgi:hypothetical protein